MFKLNKGQTLGQKTKFDISPIIHNFVNKENLIIVPTQNISINATHYKK